MRLTEKIATSIPLTGHEFKEGRDSEVQRLISEI